MRGDEGGRSPILSHLSIERSESGVKVRVKSGAADDGRGESTLIHHATAHSINLYDESISYRDNHSSNAITVHGLSMIRKVYLVKGSEMMIMK